MKNAIDFPAPATDHEPSYADGHAIVGATVLGSFAFGDAAIDFRNLDGPGDPEELQHA